MEINRNYMDWLDI